MLELLTSKLTEALEGSGEEDPQGEPAEFWWNSSAPLPNSFVLVDSDWDFGEAESGSLNLVGNWRWRRPPQIRAYVSSISSAAGVEIAQWKGPVPLGLIGVESQSIPWIRIEKEILPSNYLEVTTNLLMELHSKCKLRSVSKEAVTVQTICVIYPIELAWKVQGHGFLFLTFFGSKAEFKSRPFDVTRQVVQTLRAGPADVGARSRLRDQLAGKSITLLGLGSLGAPAGIELAKSGIGTLRAVDGDSVEPGNSTRWIAGASTWGQRKVAAFGSLLASEYPWTSFVGEDFTIGQISVDLASSDDKTVLPLVSAADLVLDCTAEFGVTTLAWDYAQDCGKPLVVAFATPTLAGGVVAVFAPGGACPTCLEHHFHEESITRPAGHGDETALEQPAGCSQRTFRGASYDLNEISAEAVRCCVDILIDEEPIQESYVEVLTMQKEGRRVPPSWTRAAFAHHEKCGCQR